MEKQQARQLLLKYATARVYLHSIFILVIVSCQPLFQVVYVSGYHFKWLVAYGPMSLIFYATTLLCVYFTAFVVLRNRPKLKPGISLAIKIAGLIAVFFLYVPLRFLVEQKIEFWLLGVSNYPQGVAFGYYFHDNLVYSFIILVAAAYVKFMDNWYIAERLKSNLEKQNLRLELDFLKSQVNPHFLFNTLNNIQSFIVQDDKVKSIELIGRLSEFMRFALYECDEEYIDLDKEISMLADYVELERVRCDDRVSISLETAGDFDDYKIPPLLLMPFVENAFKHGADTQLGESWIKIQIKQEHNQLNLKVENDFVEHQHVSVTKAGGIGLANVKKRLQFYFSGKHLLQTVAKNNVYTASLTLQLSPVITQKISLSYTLSQ